MPNNEENNKKTTDAQKETKTNSASENYNEAVALYQAGRFADALPVFEKAAQIYTELIEEDENPDFLIELAKTYIFRGSALWSAGKLDEVVGEIDKAIAVYEDLINKHNRADFVTSLATAFMNKAVGLNTLKKPSEAIAEYDRAIAIYEKSISEEARPNWLNELAKIHLNKGVALKDSGKIDEAVAVYDKSIEIYEDLINNQNLPDLAVQLAAVYMNKGTALEAQENLTEAVKMYGSAIEIWEKDLREGYSQSVPDLVKGLRIRTLISAKLDDWEQMATDVIFSMLLFETYLKKENYSEHYKKNISSEFYVSLFQLKHVAEENREKVLEITDRIGREAYDPPVVFSDVLRKRMELI